MDIFNAFFETALQSPVVILDFAVVGYRQHFFLAGKPHLDENETKCLSGTHLYAARSCCRDGITPEIAAGVVRLCKLIVVCITRFLIDLSCACAKQDRKGKGNR